ncbi:SLC13 family permease [Companilactobacillus mishanensis]|uniref:Sodium:cation symporter n=1 Tax=Companilactobacillus mishanensis TaxID=2486008 RepID=A0A5P0ZJK8_9LACO|nr:SLC13 family permease [Companilactobacillus mishanensis]MQS45311.1 sodium:cation symporter [Companilactobacillus mishanensis]MQS53269.1 sodium:cation symporter [Companilactobacillus mishanensis]MQS90047.1 sodium:cation symporter [Companilactobacillus mishanensis]
MNVLKRVFSDRVLWIAGAAAIITSFISPPQLTDINWKTITSLLSMMIIIQIYDYLDLLKYYAAYLTRQAKTTRQLIFMLASLAFFGAMFLTNDVTILTLVPLFYKITKNLKINPIYPVIIIALAANLGSIFTPFGNTHNLFLLTHFNLDINQFFVMSTPITIINFIAIFIVTRFFPKNKIKLTQLPSVELNVPSLTLTLMVTIVIFLGIFSVIPMWGSLVAALLLVVFINPKILQVVDYSIVLIFMCFFIAVGNINRDPTIVNHLSGLIQTKTGTYLASIVTSQFISNVPTTILMSKFSTYVHAIFLGTNIGGLGTVIASLANLLAFKQYRFYFKENTGKYLLSFSAINFTLLIILGMIGYFLIDIIPT